MSKKDIPDSIKNRDILDSFKDREKFLEEEFNRQIEKFGEKLRERILLKKFGVHITAIPENPLFLECIDDFEPPFFSNGIAAKKGQQTITLKCTSDRKTFSKKQIIQGVRFDKMDPTGLRQAACEFHYNGLIEYYFFPNLPDSLNVVYISEIEAWIVHVMAAVDKFRKMTNSKTDYFMFLQIRHTGNPKVTVKTHPSLRSDSHHFDDDLEFPIYRLGNESQFNNFLTHLDRNLLNAAGFTYYNEAGSEWQVDFKNLKPISPAQ